MCVFSCWVSLQEVLPETKETLSHDLMGRRGRTGLCTGKIGEVGERERQQLSGTAVLGCPCPQDWLRDEANGVWSFWGITNFGFSKVDLGSLDLPAH